MQRRNAIPITVGLIATIMVCPVAAQEATPQPRERAASPHTRGDLVLARPAVRIAELRAHYPGLTESRRTNGAITATPNGGLQSSGRRELFVPAAVRLDGRIFDQIQIRSGVGADLTYLVSQAPAASVDECESRFRDLLAAAADQLRFAPSGWNGAGAGPVQSEDPFSVHWRWDQTARSPMFYHKQYLNPDPPASQPRRAAGGASYAMLQTLPYQTGPRPFAAYRGDPTGADFQMAVARFDGDYGAPADTCRLALVQSAPVKSNPVTTAVPPVLLDRAALAPPSGSLARRYSAIVPPAFGKSADASAITQGQHLRYLCVIDPLTGRLVQCRRPEGIADATPEPAPVDIYARLIESYQIRAWQDDEDNFRAQPATVDFALRPDDLPPVVDWDAPGSLSSTALSFNRSLVISSNDYPSRALRSDIEATVVIDCIILSDLSPWCGRISITPPEAAVAFSTVPALIRRRQAARTADPVLADGTKAVGRRFSQRINFKIPQ